MATFPIALWQVHSDNVGMHDPCLPACGCPRNRFVFFPRLTVPTDTLWCHSRYKPRQGIHFRSWVRAVWGSKGGSFPNDLLQLFLAQRRTPGPIPYPNARGGQEKARKATRRASRLVLFPSGSRGRLKWGSAFLSLCSCALFLSLAPAPFALVPLLIIAGDWAQGVSDPRI